MRESCVYCTWYKGNKMPNNYIGSVYTDKLEDAYHGSVSSKKWKNIWEDELKNHPELFETEILMRFSNRQDATNFEELLQRKLDVVKNDMYINEAFANKGFSSKGHSWNCKSHRENITNVMEYGIEKSIEISNKISSSSLGRIPWNKGKTGCQAAWNKGKTGCQAAWNKGKTFSNESKNRMSISSKGKLNASWKNIGIYNENNELVYSNIENLKEFCIKNDIPYFSFRKSWQNKGSLLYIKTKPRKSVYNKFMGWYALEI